MHSQPLSILHVPERLRAAEYFHWRCATTTEPWSLQHTLPFLIGLSCVFTHGSHQTASWLPVDEGGIAFHINGCYAFILYSQTTIHLRRPIPAHVLLIKTQLGREQRIWFTWRKRGKKIENRSVEQKVGLLQEFKLQWAEASFVS